jgi:cytochrome c553
MIRVGYRKLQLLAVAGMVLSSTLQAREPDLEIGEEINQVCAGCHGEFGEGGKQGEYPRLAGQPAGFLAQQLHLFRDRSLLNLAMVEHVDERQTTDEDIQDISAYLAAIELPTRMEPMDEDDPRFDALARLEEAKRVLQIPPAEGDVDNGARLYKRECASCHGRDGMGDVADAVPMLAGQYTQYLWRQVDKYRKGVRIHDPSAPEDRLLAEFDHTELRDIFAYASRLDD